jgi:hypothetical protein
MKMALKIFLLCGLLASAQLWSGCAGYTLGPVGGQSAGERTVRVETFQNRTLEPRLTDAVANQVRKEVQRDGTFKLETQGVGDYLISGEIVRYERRELSFTSQDVETVQDFRVGLTANVRIYDRGAGKVVYEGPVEGHTLVRVGTDLVSSERQALPLLAGDLARKIVARLAEPSW